jgi:serine/threonine-protein kinase HipA
MAVAKSEISIWVYDHREVFDKPILMGKLYAAKSKGKEIFSFEYSTNWLQQYHGAGLDPHLQLFSGRQFLPDDKINFGLFLDSSPDRWGRTLMKRREAILARKEDRKLHQLSESDFLLGVFDETRMGALRFSLEEDGAFLNNNPEMAAPPFTLLRDLEFASLQLEDETLKENNQMLKWLNMLMAPGSSLGGARPKASVKDTNGNLWIAKFPGKNDERNMGAWEMVAHRLAAKAGIRTPQGDLKKLSSRHHTFITKRFDRTAKNKRLHFASAMTLLGYNDGTDHHHGASYLELAEFIIRHGANINTELEELWRRIVFSIFIKNTDDHLRNHGFLLTATGWKLSPAFDINPVPDGTGLTLNINQYDNSLVPELALEVAPYFRINKAEVDKIIKKIKKAVARWREEAALCGIPKNEQQRMAAAFELAE